jgi:hypothetical protein
MGRVTITFYPSDRKQSKTTRDTHHTLNVEQLIKPNYMDYSFILAPSRIALTFVDFQQPINSCECQ